MRADRRGLMAVFAGGCAGTLARALLGEALPHDPGTGPGIALGGLRLAR